MSNKPPAHELFLLADGQSKISMTMDTKIPNAASFTIQKEDHTLANLLRMQLLKNPQVIFAGYKVPHPLEHYFLLKVQTTPDTTPRDVLQAEIDYLIKHVEDLHRKFKFEMTSRGVMPDRAPVD